MNSNDDIYGLEYDDRENEFRREASRSIDGYDRDRLDANHCPTCGYAIGAGASGNFCPGCGAPLRFSPYAQPTSGYAITSLIMGILAVLSCLLYGIGSLVFGPLAIIFATKARAEVAAGRASPGSLGLATAGRVLGIVGISIFVAVVLAFVAAFVLGIGSVAP